MICTICKQEMDINARNCGNCGAINPHHPDNKSIMEFLNTKKDNPFKIDPPKKIRKMNKIMFIIVNLIILSSPIAFSFIQKNLLIPSIIGTIIAGFYIICFELIIHKASQPWWGLFIPMYNIYILSKVAFESLIPLLLYAVCLVLIMIVPFLGIEVLSGTLATLLAIISSIFPLIFLFCLGRKFKKSGILTVLFPFILIPIIAISPKCQYYEKNHFVK